VRRGLSERVPKNYFEWEPTTGFGSSTDMGAISRIITDKTDQEFQAQGLNFRYITSDYHLHKTSKDEIIILKNSKFMQSYEPVFERAPTRNVLEFGVFEGGSIILFALAYPEFRFVGIDIREPNEEVIRHIRSLDLEDRVKIYYNVNQTDKVGIDKIISTEFKDNPPAIIFDDASHSYSYSKSTFELTFGRLAPGGSYCLEDWAWAHWGEPFQTQQWADQPALTNLVFEILIMYASTYDLIDGIEIRPALACIRRGGAKLSEFQIDGLMRLRGKKLTFI
jgi:cephalosporin hydroxylase